MSKILSTDYVNVNEIYNTVYPIGSIYMSINNVDPSTLFGGTWEQIKDKFLLSAGDTYSAGSTGGSADAVNVAHRHGKIQALGNDAWEFVSNTNLGGTHTVAHAIHPATTQSENITIGGLQTSEAGVSGKGKNMPPYLTVYMWKRTA